MQTEIKTDGEGMRQVLTMARSSMGIQRVQHGALPIDVPIVVVPNDYRVESLAHLIPERPAGIRAKVELVDLDSFIDYILEHKGPTSRVFANVLREPFALVCALDYHGGNNLADAKQRPEFVTHTCCLTFTPTDAWREWKQHNGEWMQQDAFAQFVEERQPDVMEPKGADMLELARSIEATRDVGFKRRLRLDNGDVSFAFDDKTEATAGMNGQLRIPEKMVLQFPMFLGMPLQNIDCRFRYRLDAGHLMLAYEVVRIRELQLKAIRDALDIVVDRTELTAFLGSYT